MAKPNETPDPFASIKQMLEQFKMPGVDLQAIGEARRKDLEALMTANKTAVAAMQELAKKQTEMFTAAMQNMQTSLQSMGDPMKQTELARNAYESTVKQMQELAALAQKAQSDAAAAITKRVQQSMEEMKALLQSK